MSNSDRTFASLSSLNAETLANALGGRKSGDGWVARCPAHKDRNPSLSIQEKHEKVLLHCFAGCSQDDVLKALRQHGLWQDKPQAGVRTVHRNIPPARYLYLPIGRPRPCGNGTTRYR